MMTAAFLQARKDNYSLVCNSFDASSKNMANITWVFYLSKILDFCDTFFIVVRGKWQQFSFLHIYHHISIFLTYWIITVAAYDGDVYYTIIANSFIHSVMYFYYLLTSLNIRPAWGRYLTQLQMLQFITMNAQAIYILTYKCPYPQPLVRYYLVYIISLFALFMNFYLQRWTPKEKVAGKASKSKKL
jgi:elongation of very long chain fatty acids protein 4